MISPICNLDAPYYLSEALADNATRTWGECIYDSTIGLVVKVAKAIFSWVCCCYGSIDVKNTNEFAPVKIPKTMPNVAGMDPRKKIWFQLALNRFFKFGLPSRYGFVVQNEGPYVLTQSKSPSYFKQAYTEHSIRCSSTPAFYNYDGVPGNYEAWVDFANKQLGGTPFTYGCVQEEIMVAEFPQMMAHLLKNFDPRYGRDLRSRILTRIGPDPRTSDRVKEGSPRPLLMTNMERTQKVVGVYGRQFSRVTVQDAATYTKPLPKAQVVNILAMAAPKLSHDDRREQTRLATIQDLFNTFIAGFDLVKVSATKAGERGLVHTGPIGSGCFHNSRIVVYVLQKLAATHLGIDIRFHGYSNRDAARGDALCAEVLHTFQKGQTVEQLLQTATTILSKRLK